MTKGKIITVSVSVELTEDTGKDLHTELTGIAHECLTALRAMIPDSESRSALWKVETLEDIGIGENPRRLRRRYRGQRFNGRSDVEPVEPHAFLQRLDLPFTRRGECAICGEPASDPIHKTANDKPQ